MSSKIILMFALYAKIQSGYELTKCIDGTLTFLYLLKERRLVPKDIPELLTAAASFVVYKLPISP